MIVEKKNGSIQSGEYTITNLGEKEYYQEVSHRFFRD